MALVLGTNCGFVTTAPTDDPVGSTVGADGEGCAMKDVAPIGAIKVTEIGWWCDNASVTTNFEVGIYDHNSTDSEPENLLDGHSHTNAKGTTAGWKRVTGLNITITAGTTYWIALQVDTSASSTYTNQATTGGTAQAKKTSQTTLTNPWGTSNYKNANFMMAFYAVYETAAPTGTNSFINIGDNFKPISNKWINIGDVWKPVTTEYINIGDVWKKVF